MAGFTLTKDGTHYDCAPDGTVTVSGDAAGHWTTNDSDQIEIAKSDGSKETLDATWKFDAQNHLGIYGPNGLLFDFNSDSAHPTGFAMPREDAELQVFPDGNASGFTLHPAWDLQADHSMKVTIGSAVSTLRGQLKSNSTSRFIFMFRTASNGSQILLSFTGQWNCDTTDAGLPVVTFAYKSGHGVQTEFKMPGDLKMNASINQFSYELTNGGRTQKITLAGILQVSPSMQITYQIVQQSGGGKTAVGASTIALKAVVQNRTLTGNLQLTITDKDNKPGHFSIEISGQYTALIHNGKLTVGFRFAQGGVCGTTFLFSGKLELDHGPTFTWTFGRDAGGTTASIAVDDIHFRNGVSGNVALDFHNGNLSLTVTVLFGVPFAA